MRKIVIIGSPGAGKSTFAQALGRILNIEVFHLDRYFWRPDWKEYRREARIQIEQQSILTRGQWIIEGSYLGSSDNRLHAADTIIFLDMPYFLCLWRAITRHMKYRTHIPQFRERKNRIVNRQDQAGEESADEELAVPGLAFASVSQRGCARDQCPQNTGKPSASWGDWLACSPG